MSVGMALITLGVILSAGVLLVWTLTQIMEPIIRADLDRQDARIQAQLDEHGRERGATW